MIARRVGALPELVRHGVDGFLADDPPQMSFLVDRVAELDRSAIRTRALEQFSASRMVDDYEKIYFRLLGDRLSQKADPFKVRPRLRATSLTRRLPPALTLPGRPRRTDDHQRPQEANETARRIRP